LKNYHSIHYKILGSPGGLDLESLAIQEDDFHELKKNIKQLLQDQKFSDAVTFATKAALLYGVPGLILYLKVSFASQKLDKQKGNFSEQKAFDNLTLALLTKKLLKLDPEAHQMVTQLLPSEPVNEANYLQDVIDNFISLQTTELTNYFDECDNLSNSLLEHCLNHHHVNGPRVN
jgi:hypothetical protein